MAQLTALINAVKSLPRRVDTDAFRQFRHEIEGLTLLVLLRILEQTPATNRIAWVNLIAYIRDLAASFNVTEDDILVRVRSSAPHLLPQYNQVFNRNEPSPNNTDEDYIKLSNALGSLKKDNHALSFDSLCTFIESFTFDASNFTRVKNAKMYQVYHELSHPEKDEFMKAYLNFNYKKQLLVEEASQNIYKPISDSSKMIGFTALHKKWIQSWIQETSQRLQKCIENDAHFEKYAFIFNHLSPEHVVSLFLTHMLSSTVPKTHAKVFSLANAICRSLRKELTQADKVVFSPANLPIVLSSDHAMEFAYSIMNLVLEGCSLPETSEVNIQGDQEWERRVFRLSYAADEDSTVKFIRHGVIQIHPVVAEHFHIYQELFQAGSYNLPMLHPPKHWTSPRDGGFFSIPLPLVKSSEPNTSDAYMKKAHHTGQLSSVYQSVNALGACPWTINEFTLTAFSSLMKSPNAPGLPATLRPQIEKNTPKPKRASFACDDTYQSALASWRYIEAQNTRKLQDARNLRIYYTMVNRLAHGFAKRGEVLYLPHNMDFRGRVYPAVSFLSHQGEDLVRSLLMFWEAKPLGPHGYDWLVYHLANLFSKSKMTMEESKEFVANNRDAIVASATNPLEKDSWWLRADNPWQTLALCNEFKSIWSFSGGVSTYTSRIPVHQDGSCNGLQHYAALGADKAAAHAVNVLPEEKMQDVYMAVLGLVREKMDALQAADTEGSDEANANTSKSFIHETESTEGDTPKAQAALARMALPLLSRKLIKQTVMTTVYGVTQYGASKQVKRRIDEALDDMPSATMSSSERSRLASFISKHILSCISDLFAGAKLIQNWLVDNCTRCIQAYDARDFPNKEKVEFFSGAHFRPMMWTSLSGFPVIQMYRKRILRVISTPLQTLVLNDDARIAPIDELKSRNGMAPNFIHSIDAIHLLMTCLGAKTQNITFASVHDSFWTHPSEVAVLSGIIREEFARLHSSGIIDNLRQDLAYINRNSFQLVWVNIGEHTEFTGELKTLREGYSEVSAKKLSEKRLNTCLGLELRDNSRINALVDKFKPTVIWQPSASGSPFIYDESSLPQAVQTKISLKTHMPLLVPVKILEAPAVGTLDIQSVLESKYFFS
ncbi:hypothetical protein JCM33374_g3703 [Metschnikowia sp. JCM 33374]|nr:hypothetical protein JCM33374_g3703 [Metschnikowia sp. JCM 33374]